MKKIVGSILFDIMVSASKALAILSFKFNVPELLGYSVYCLRVAGEYGYAKETN